MAKMTLIEMVQDILSDMNSDEVNSISDTEESLQVAQILKTTFYEIYSLRLWPTHATLVQLTTAADADNPTKVSLPDNITEISDIKYDVRDDGSDPIEYRSVKYMPPSDFLAYMYSRKSTNSNVKTVTISGTIKLLVLTDKAPEYYTSFDDEVIYFDSYDSDVDTTIQSSKIICMATVEPTFSLTDTFTPDMPAKAFPYYLAEAKSVCFEKIKQAPSAKEEQRSRRQRTRLMREKRRIGRYDTYVGYGRK